MGNLQETKVSLQAKESRLILRRTMTKTELLLEKAKEIHLEVKSIVMELLTSPMSEEQKELVLKLYRLVK